MEHVFLLLVYLGTGDFRQFESGDMYFRSITECNFFAKEMSKRYGNYEFSYLMDQRTGSQLTVSQNTSRKGLSTSTRGGK